jgi:hypothetical protein
MKDGIHGFCCIYGKIVLHQFEDPSYLIKILIDNSHSLLKNFFDNSV